jgi:hypothetical protein
MQPLGYAGAFEHLHRSLFENAGTDSAFDMGAAALFEDDVFDSRPMEKLRQQKAGWPGADDDDLRSHPPTLEQAGKNGDSNR